jgi:8-amino-7-oxononanoate synthase
VSRDTVWEHRWQEALAERQAQGLYRRPRLLEHRDGVHARLEGRDCLVFCSNDYLGLADHPVISAALAQAASELGTGSGAAHLISGHHREHEALEAELADWLGRPRALLFSTGYMANMGVINALTEPDDTVYEDALNHASLLDGGWLSRGRMQRYAHGDIAALDAALAQTAGRALIATDAVFSMDGDLAPLPALAELAVRREALLVVDDAHGFGVLGNGPGSVAHFGLTPDQVPVYIGTLGKALGTFGAFVAGSETLIDHLIQRARTYIYTTAPPPALAAATRTALGLARQDAWRREHLVELVARFRDGARRLGLPLMASNTPIQPLWVGDAARAMALGGALLEAGYWVTPIRPPTVPPGTARLRITLTAAHTPAQVDGLLGALARCLDMPMDAPG